MRPVCLWLTSLLSPCQCLLLDKRKCQRDFGKCHLSWLSGRVCNPDWLWLLDIYITRGGSEKLYKMLCFSVITALNIPFCRNGFDFVPFTSSPLVWIVSTSPAALAGLFYEAVYQAPSKCLACGGVQIGDSLHSQTKTCTALLRIVQNPWVEVSVCGARGAPDSSDNLLVFVGAHVWAARWIWGHLAVLYRKDNPPPHPPPTPKKTSGLTGTINWFSRIV